jgi:hypothetical protein
MLSQSSLSVGLSATESITPASGNVDSHPIASQPTITQLTDGTGANKAQKAGRRVLTLSTTPTDLDLTAFAGGINSAAINFSLVKQVLIRSLEVTPSVLAFTVTTTPLTNGWTNFLGAGIPSLGPYEFSLRMHHTNGIAVTPTNKVLRLTALSGAPTCEVLIVGEGT